MLILRLIALTTKILLTTMRLCRGSDKNNKNMGQLESYTLQDIYLIAIVSGILSTYFAEEVEATIESVVSYLYSANLSSKKRRKVVALKVPTGDIIGAMHSSYNFRGLTKASFIAIGKPIDEKTI